MLPAPRDAFADLPDDCVHLATGGQPPMLKAHQQAFTQFVADKAHGQGGYERHWAVVRAAKSKLARLTHIAAADHAFVGSASEAIGRVVSAFDWQAGDNVVVAEKDYASGRFSLLQLARLGVEPRIVPSEGWAIDPEGLMAACDQNTRLMYISQVTSFTGQRFDIQWLSAQVSEIGVALLVDASHALGVVPVDGRLADFTVSAGYKFLCSSHMGILAWNRERQPRFDPMTIGWASAVDGPGGRSFTLHDDGGRAESGNPNHLDVYVLDRSLDFLLGYGIETIAPYVQGLTNRLHDGVCALGLDVVTPASPDQRGSSVSFASDSDKDIQQRAWRDGIYVWDGGKRVRATAHFFNTTDDVAQYIEWLARHVAA